MNARRHPRTMADAFGPYTDNKLFEPSPAVFAGWLKWREARAKAVIAKAIKDVA